MAKKKTTAAKDEKTSSGLGAVGGVAAGAAAGSLFGPVGAAVGAVVGGITGATQGKKMIGQAGRMIRSSKKRTPVKKVATKMRGSKTPVKKTASKTKSAGTRKK